MFLIDCLDDLRSNLLKLFQCRLSVITFGLIEVGFEIAADTWIRNRLEGKTSSIISGG